MYDNTSDRKNSQVSWFLAWGCGSEKLLPPIQYGILILKVGWITENLAELKFDLVVLEGLKSVYSVDLSVLFFFSQQTLRVKKHLQDKGEEQQ